MRRAAPLFKSSLARQVLRVLGALLLLFVGFDHYYQYSVQSYSVVPTIGTLFLLNFISATAIGLLLLIPLERVMPRHGLMVVRAASIAGFGIAATSLIALLVSEQTKLFGFMESNYRPAIVVAIASEAAAAVVLAVLALSGRSAQVHRAANERASMPADDQRVEPRRQPVTRPQHDG
jgi:hypothetical protein